MTKKIILPPQQGTPSDVERIKSESNYLRGSLVETLEISNQFGDYLTMIID